MSRSCSLDVTGMFARCHADVLMMSQLYTIINILRDVISLKEAEMGRQTFGTNFLITIHNQENHSWQGVVEWLDTGKKLHFRSELELMNLIHGAVEMQSESQETLRTWNDERHINAI